MKSFLVLNKKSMGSIYWVSIREINISAKPIMVMMSKKNAEMIEKVVLKDANMKNKYSSISNVANADKAVISNPVFIPKTIGKGKKQDIIWKVTSFVLGNKAKEKKEKNKYLEYIETITLQKRRIKQLEKANEKLKSLIKKKSASEEFERGRQSVIAELGLEL